MHACMACLMIKNTITKRWKRCSMGAGWLRSLAFIIKKTLVFWSWAKPSLAEGCCFAFVFVAVAVASFKASA